MNCTSRDDCTCEPPLERVTHHHGGAACHSCGTNARARTRCALTDGVTGFDADWGHAQWVADTLAKYKLRYVVGHGMLFPMLRFGDTVTKQLDAGGTSAWTADNDFDLYLIDPPRDIYSKLEEECKRAGYTSSGGGGRCSFSSHNPAFHNHSALNVVDFQRAWTSACDQVTDTPRHHTVCNFSVAEAPPELGPEILFSFDPPFWLPRDAVWPPRKANLHGITLMVPQDPLRFLSSSPAYQEKPTKVEYGVGCYGAAYAQKVTWKKMQAPPSALQPGGYLTARRYERALYDCAKALDSAGFASFFGHCYDVDAKHEITSKDVRTDSNASVFVHRMQKRWAEKHVHDFKMCGGKWVHKRYLVSQRCPN